MKSKLFFRVFIPLALGAALYVLLCPEAFVSRGFYALTGLRPPEIACGGAALRLVRNHLADMLWAWALTCCASLALGPGKGVHAAAIAAVTGLLVELVQQRLGVGTFDWLDAALELAAAAAAGAYIIYSERRERQ